MRVGVGKFLMPAGMGLAALALGAAALPPVLSQSGGLWEVSRSATGSKADKVCAPQAAAFAQWEHRRIRCTRTILRSSATDAVINYTCPSGDFGRSHVRVITPRTLRIETQGISQGFPFNYVLHARRIGNCPGQTQSH
jgi:hypothetical protein